MTLFYPSRRAVLVVALGVPIALLAVLAAPALWLAGPLWSALGASLVLLDGWTGAQPAALAVQPVLPGEMGVGRKYAARFLLSFTGRAPAAVEMELEGNDRFAIAPLRRHLVVQGAQAQDGFELTALRRGPGHLAQLWLRWTGPLGLAWIQHRHALGRDVPVIPDMETVRGQAMRLFARDSGRGLLERINSGSGTEFQALHKFQPGHDRRQIDWKQSARHSELVVKQFRMEQNQHIVMALDTGRLMSAPLRGQPRLDRALQAMLLLAFVGLKLGDRMGLFAFDSRPRLRSGTVSGMKSFAQLQRLAAGLEYSDAETNFTLGLTQLSGSLDRRSVIVIFTDFADTTGAELMLENLARLLQRHTILFVVFRDETLEEMAEAQPQVSQDVSRAIIADRLLTEREIVLARLRQMGVTVVDVPLAAMGEGVVDAYIAHKQHLRLQP